MMRCNAESDELQCTVQGYIKPSGLCYYHDKMRRKLLEPSRQVERVVDLGTGAVIYMKGAKA